MKGSSMGYLLKTGFKNVYMNRLMSFASIGVLVACLMLIGSAVLLSLNNCGRRRGRKRDGCLFGYGYSR